MKMWADLYLYLELKCGSVDSTSRPNGSGNTWIVYINMSVTDHVLYITLDVMKHINITSTGSKTNMKSGYCDSPRCNLQPHIYVLLQGCLMKKFLIFLCIM